jgi:hypothetical protein
LLLPGALGFALALLFGPLLLLLLLPVALGLGRPLGFALALLFGPLLLLLLTGALGFGLALPFRLLRILPEGRPAGRQPQSQHAHQRYPKWPPHKSLQLLPARPVPAS